MFSTAWNTQRDSELSREGKGEGGDSSDVGEKSTNKKSSESSCLKKRLASFSVWFQPPTEVFNNEFIMGIANRSKITCDQRWTLIKVDSDKVESV